MMVISGRKKGSWEEWREESLGVWYNIKLLVVSVGKPYTRKALALHSTDFDSILGTS